MMMQRAECELASTVGVAIPAISKSAKEVSVISKSDRRKRNNWIRDATDAMSGGDLVKALSCYRSAHALDPRDAKVAEQIAILSSGRGQSVLLAQQATRSSVADNSRDLAKMGKSSVMLKIGAALGRGRG